MRLDRSAPPLKTMMRILLVTSAVCVCLAATPAEARRRSWGGSDYVSNGKFGIGLELGAPSGFNGKYFYSPSNALNFGIGWLYDNYWRDGDGVHLYLDHLWHPKSLVENPTFKLPFFVGVGLRLWSFDYIDGRNDDRYGAVGIRVPFGLAFDFNNVPLDIYVQLTFVADFFYGGYRDRFGPHFEGNLGVRFWFD